MGQLLVRFGAQDQRLLERVLVRGPMAQRPSRVVLDAHVARRVDFSRCAQKAGVPLLIDPQTHYLQDRQHATFSWATLPFGGPEACTPADLSSSTRQTALVSACFEFQLEHGATALIAPYVHAETPNDGWLEVQAGLWQQSRRYLDAHGLALPIVAVVALGWRLLDPATWRRGAHQQIRSLQELAPDEIALAASKVDQGARAAERLHWFLSTLRLFGRHAPVLAWQQGSLGEAAVAGGAAGYECGLGWKERCDLRSEMARHRSARPKGGFGARPVFVPALGRSLPKASIRELLTTSLAPEVLCLEPSCCPQGASSLLDDARRHAINSRLLRMQQLGSIQTEAWRWNWVAEQSRRGLDLGVRINRIARSDRHSQLAKVDLGALQASLAVADQRRQAHSRRSAA